MIIKPLDPWDEARIVKAARGIVTRTLLVVDHHDRRWQHALGLLIAGGLDMPKNAGMALVPVGPHIGGYWDGNIPAAILEMEIVPEESVDALHAKIAEMNAALYPEIEG